MKLSNNALNFLLAQYRAIFKRAYVKGLASAVMLTAGLAAGQAQADTLSGAAALSGTDTITIGTGGYDNIQIKSDAVITSDWNAPVIINSGSTSDNYIQASGGNVTLSGTGTLTISTTNAAHGLTVSGGTTDGSGTATINIGSINLTKGTLALSANSSGSVTVAAERITIGSAESEATAGNADGTVTLSSQAASYAATLGAENSNITVTKGGKINLSGGSAGAVEVTGQSLSLTNGGVLLVSDGAGNTISVADLNVDKDSFLVVASGTNGGTGVFSGKTADLAGNLLVASGANLNINTQLPENNDNDIVGQGVVTFADGSNTQIGGTVTINSGTVVVQDGAKLHASEDAAAIKITDAGSAESTLQISRDTLTRFLTGEDVSGNASTYTSINENGSLSATANDASGESGAIVLSGGRLELTGTEQIDLTKSFNFSGADTASAGLIAVHTTAGGTIYGQNLQLSNKLTKDGTDAAGTSSLTIEAENLTLGDTTVDASTSAIDFGISGATAQNLTVETQAGGTFKLGEAVTLDVTVGDDTVVDGESGEIKNAMVITTGGSLTAAHGNFSGSDALTISGGTLAVTNSALDTTPESYMDTVLTLTGPLTLQAVTGSKISVDGGDTDEHGVETVLDITGATLKVESGANTAAVEVVSGGTLVLKGSQLADELLHDFSSASKSGASVTLSGGTIRVIDNLTLDATAQITSSTADHKLAFDSTKGGTLEVANQLKLTNVSNLNIGANGNIKAGILNLNGANNETAATLSSGNYIAISSLTTDSNKVGVTVGEGANITLGLIEGQGTNADPFVAQGGGSLSTNLTIDNGAVTVVYGDWIGGKDITVTAGNLTVGDLNGAVAKTDAAGNTLEASLTLGALSIADGATTVVKETGTLNVNGLTSAGSNALSVTGDMTVKGQITKAEDNKTITSYGLDIGANSVLVDKGGLLTFTGDAVEALKYTATSGTAGYFDAADSYAADGITVNAGGTVRFDFAEGTSFNTDALKELRTEVFNTAGGNVDGTISLGAGSIAGIEADTDGKYDWNDLESISEFLPTFEFDALKAGVVKNIETGSQVRGHFGALESSTMTSGGKATIVGNSSLNNADANNGKFASGVNGAVLGLDIQNGSYVELNNGGAIGAVSLDADSTLAINADQDITAPAETVIASIDGEDATAEFNLGVTRITGNTNVGTLITTANSNVTFSGTTTVGARGSTSTEVTELLGTNTFVGTATFNTETEISGVATAFQDGVTFNKWAGIYGDTTVSGGAVLSSGAEIGGAATLTADSIELSGSGIRFSVGEEDYVENGQTHSGSTGYLQTASMVLNGNTLIVDPSYDHATSIAAIEDFDDVVNNDEDAGTFSGTIFVGQNAALGVGQDITVAAVAEFIKQYQNSQGALIQDQVGSVLYLDGMLTAATGSQLILDSQHTKTQVFDGSSTTPALISDGSTYWGKFGTETTARQADLYLGQNTIMAVSDNILSQGAAIHFESGDAAIMAQSVKDSSDAAKIVLDGNGFLDSRSVTLFTDTGSNTGVKILGDQDIRVETLNGVMYFMLRAGDETSGGTLQLDTTKIDTAYLGATDVSRDLLFAYSSQTANWDEYFDEANLAKDNTDKTKVQREQLHGAAASSNLYTYDSTNGFQLSQAAQDAGYQTSDFVVIEHTDYEGNTTAEVYHRAYNDLLERIVRDTNGAAADGAALQGVFGGAAQAALLAARTSQDAVAGRTGMGATKSALTFADNGQGAGLWVAPIYVSQDSDGFAVSNKDYGVDIDLYGVALGGDYTLSNGLRVGAFFNVGSGDADGNGQAGGVSNDFDYYGVGLYAGYSIGQFSLVGDVSYTVVDSDIDASTQVGSIKSSFDTDNISVGVTGQYEFVLGGAQVTPHAGLRYSALSFDDSTFAAGGYDNGGHSELDDVNVFSIPVGVTVAKEFAFDTWTVKPSFDVTLQGNFGDDELDSNAQWDGVAWQSTYTAEFLDNFTYGATLGVAASTGSFSAGLGLGYTGSENTDEFSATANARFTF